MTEARLAADPVAVLYSKLQPNPNSRVKLGSSGSRPTALTNAREGGFALFLMLDTQEHQMSSVVEYWTEKYKPNTEPAAVFMIQESE